MAKQKVDDLWEKVKNVEGMFYEHYPSYYTGNKAAADKEARMFGKMNFSVVVVKKRFKGNDGKTRDVYSLYMRKVLDDRQQKSMRE